MRSYSPLLGCTVWILLLGSCQGLGHYVTELGNWQVTSPGSLRGIYESSMARFGIPAHGGSLAGEVVYMTANPRGCDAFDRYDLSFQPAAGRLPVILLVDRGDCFFSLKVYNAHKAGASAVLIVDNRFEPLVFMETPEEADWKGSNQQKTNIPSALISKDVGDEIKKVLSRGELVSIKLLFKYPSEVASPPCEPVKFDLWISGNLGCEPKWQDQLEFVRKFAEVSWIFEGRGYAQFTPHFVTWYCPEAFSSNSRCKSQCINHGRYCSPDPLEEHFHSGCQNQTDGMIHPGCFRGRDIAIQSLVHACIHKLAKASGKPWLWWEYVYDFYIRCSMKNAMYMSSCRDMIIRRLGLDINELNECVGDTEADKEQPLLEAKQDARIGGLGRGNDVTVVPTLVINGNHYRGKLIKEDVIEAICAALKDKVKPKICPKVVIPEGAKQDIVPVDLHGPLKLLYRTWRVLNPNRMAGWFGFFP